MQRQRLFRGVVSGLLFAVLFSSGSVAALVAPPISSSENYKMVDSDFSGGTGGPSGCSSGYCNESHGAGTSGSEDDAILEVSVNPGPSDLGTLSVEATAKKTATVTVRNYLSYGYTMQVIGSAPKYGNHTISTMAVPTAAQPGVEQFGINVVKNTTPNVGADPAQEPADGTVFGIVNPDYGTADRYKYTSGDVVAHGVSTMTETGQTTYTISMIMNISNTTPAGNYATDLSVVVVPIY